MKSLIKYVDQSIKWLLILLLIIMVLDVTWQVFTRFILRDPSSFTEELATFLLIWIGLLGSTYALREKAHLGIDVLTTRFSGKRKHWSEIFIYSVVIIFAVSVLIWGGLRLVNITLYLNQISAALRIKMGYVYLVLPITGILLIIYSLGFITESLNQLKEISK